MGGSGDLCVTLRDFETLMLAGWSEIYLGDRVWGGGYAPIRLHLVWLHDCIHELWRVICNETNS